MAITIAGGTGFDRGGITAVNRYFESITTNGSYPQIQTGTGRRSGNCLRLNYTSKIVKTTPADDEFEIAIAMRPNSLPGNTVWFRLTRAGNAQISAKIETDGRVSFGLGSATTGLGTTVGGFSVGFFSQLVIYVKISDTIGELRAYWNGSSTADTGVDLSGIDTKGYAGAGAADALVDGYQFGGGNDAATFDLDDLVWAYGGADVLGDLAVVADVPQSDGTHEDLTCTTGTNMTAMVNDATPDVDDSSTIAAETGQATFNYTPLPYTPASVAAVITKAMAKKDDAGTRTIADFLDNGTEYTGTAVDLTTEYKIHDLVRQDIAAAPLTKTNIDAAEWGTSLA